MLELGELLACCFRYLYKFYRAATYYMHYKSKVENSVLMILKCPKGLADWPYSIASITQQAIFRGLTKFEISICFSWLVQST
jgi:hypothetical protein